VVRTVNGDLVRAGISHGHGTGPAAANALRFLVPGVRRLSYWGSFGSVIENHPTHGGMVYRRAIQAHRWHVKIHADENFLLKS
jgi:hypothetical protein